MGKHDRCCVGGCDNDKRYLHLCVKRRHVEGDLIWHRFPKDPKKFEIWRKNIKRGLEFFNPGHETFVCSNHFVDGKPTMNNPHPTLFLQPSDKQRRSPQKRSTRTKLPETSHSCEPSILIGSHSTSNNCPEMLADDAHMEESKDADMEDCSEDKTVFIPMRIEQLTREHDVHFNTGLNGTAAFNALFDLVGKKAAIMNYWKGEKNSKSKTNEKFEAYSKRLNVILSQPCEDTGSLRRGPPRKLTLEQELLLTLMRLRLGLLLEDLAWRFNISAGTASSIFITWVKLLSKELSWFIIWPSRPQIRSALPNCFRKCYPRVRVIIDCSEIFVETPSSLDVQAALWSDYKHHTTVKFLYGITPNGASSYISPCYGGRATDIHIVRDSGFLKKLEPFDQVMADRSFKIQNDLLSHSATLCIPPSVKTGRQMLSKEVKETSRIANVRIYVEQAIKRMKEFRIIKNELPVLLLPVIDDIVTVCASLVNLLDPLCD